LFLLLPPSSVIGPGEPIPLPAWSSEVHHEAELGVVVGARMRRVPKERALEHVLGYSCVNDVTARDVQRAQGHFTRSKGADGFCPIGPWIETELELPAELLCRVAGAGGATPETRQRGNTADMIFDVATLLSFISHSMTLEPGDVVATGTPAGVSALRAGDTVEVEIAGLGVLQNPVVGGDA
ncbi:MAG: fumarylacetoacetate hydrolase family protein, partial [Deltaproteobacteria bacterium]